MSSFLLVWCTWQQAAIISSPMNTMNMVPCRGLNKEELELYTEMKARRDAEDEAKRAVESSDEEDSDTSEDESDSDSESGSDSDI